MHSSSKTGIRTSAITATSNTARFFRSLHSRSLLLLFSAAPSRSEAASCSIGKMAEFPVTMTELRPLIPVKFNGSDATLVVDSGAFYSMLSPASAAELKRKSSSATALTNVRIEGPNGEITPLLTTVKDFSIANFPMTMNNFQFLVVEGTEPGAGSAAGLLGQNILGIADVEYDLANGAVRLMKPKDCGQATLAYWAASASLPYGVIKIDSGAKPHALHTVGEALLNGKRIRVVFDSGAPASMLTLAAARRAGIRPDSPGVVPAGTSSWIGPFASFKIGDEEMSSPHLRFSDFSMDQGDMLLGADFFLSHRIYVANSQDKLYLTSNGGPPFNLSSMPSLALEPGLRGLKFAHAAQLPSAALGTSGTGMGTGMGDPMQ